MNWDTYFYNICDQVKMKSPCMSRKIGSILVKDNIVVATGYNGPPRNVVHCNQHYNTDQCPRYAQGYGSGEGLHLCPAVHAEENCIAAAARIGAPVRNSTLYLTAEIPCTRCLGLIINAGVKQIVSKINTLYDDTAARLLNQAGICFRTFDLS